MKLKRQRVPTTASGGEGAPTGFIATFAVAAALTLSQRSTASSDMNAAKKAPNKPSTLPGRRRWEQSNIQDALINKAKPERKTREQSSKDEAKKNELLSQNVKRATEFAAAATQFQRRSSKRAIYDDKGEPIGGDPSIKAKKISEFAAASSQFQRSSERSIYNAKGEATDLQQDSRPNILQGTQSLNSGASEESQGSNIGLKI